MKKVLVLLLIGVHFLNAQGFPTSEQLIESMHARYRGRWYKTLSFVQKTTQLRPDSTKTVATWYEALSFPGKMRIDIDSMGSSGIILRDDSLYVFRAGNLTSTRSFVHPLLLLGFDIYFLPTEQTISRLKGLHFDLSLIHDDTWDGRPVFVVGAQRGDYHSPQFWIDQQYLCFVRLLEPGGKDSSQTRETQFNKYVQMGDGWVATEVVFNIDDRLVTLEEYSQVHPDPVLEPKLFDPRYWKTASWR